MRLMRNILLITCWPFVFLNTTTSNAEPPESLTQQIIDADNRLFSAVFEQCDADKVAQMLTNDFEFFHDKWGQIASQKSDFVDAIRASCKRQQDGTDFKARRDIQLASVEVSAIQKYGALQTGDHSFYRIIKGKPDQPTETARFIHLWHKQGASWKLARVISFDHQDVDSKAESN
jgi:ketosteroid isomerase-like protein